MEAYSACLVKFLPRDAYRLSVRLSVTFVNCDHIVWNSSEVIFAIS